MKIGSFLEEHGQLLLQVQYDYRDTNSVQSFVYGARLNIGSARLNLFFEHAGTVEIAADAEGDEFVGQWSGGIEVRVAEKTWISTGFGGSFSTDGADRLVMLAGLRWAVAGSPRVGRK